MLRSLRKEKNIIDVQRNDIMTKILQQIKHILAFVHNFQSILLCSFISAHMLKFAFPLPWLLIFRLDKLYFSKVLRTW